MNREVLEQEIEKERVKHTGRAFIKKAFIVTLSLIMSATAFVGCKSSENSTSNSSGSEIVDSSGGFVDGSEIEGPTTPNEPEPSIPTKPTEPVVEEIPTEGIQDFIGDLSLGNYTYEKQTEQGVESYLIDDNMMFTKVANESGVYYSYENAKMYKFVYDKDSESYFKYNEDELISFDSVVYDTLVSTDWKSFDKDADVVTGTSGSLEYSLNLTEKTLTGDVVGRVYDISTTNILKPTYVVDKTVEEPVIEPEEPVVTDPVITKTNNIYEVVDGEYVFDVVAMKEVLLNWMKGDNQYGKDFAAQRTYNATAMTDDIIYVNASETNIEFGYVYHNSAAKYFVSSYFEDTSLYAKIQSGEIKTKEQFDTYLNSINHILNLTNSRDKVEIDTTISDENFDTLTERVFDRMENKGTQGTTKNNDFPETKLENFSDAEILYGFKTVSSSAIAAHDLGIQKTWFQYYLINYNDNIELVSLAVSSSISNAVTELDNVLNDKSDWWMIISCKRENCNEKNKEIYQTNTMVATNNIVTNEEKERELS